MALDKLILNFITKNKYAQNSQDNFERKKKEEGTWPTKSDKEHLS